MTSLLSTENNLMVNPLLAKAIGLNEAIVLQQIHYWLEYNKKMNNNFYDGAYWTYNSIRIWNEKTFYFWSFETVKRTFASLEKKGLLVVGKYNAEKFDRTKWYSINYELVETLNREESSIEGTFKENQNEPNDNNRIGQTVEASTPNVLGQNDTNSKGKINQCIDSNDTKSLVQKDTNNKGKRTQYDGANSSNTLEQIDPLSEGNLPQAIPKTTTKITTKTTSGTTAKTTTTTEAMPKETERSVVSGGVYKYCEKYLGLLSSTALQEIGFFLDQGIQPEVIQLAVDASVDNNVRSWKYTSQILQKCLDNQCFTAEQYQKRDIDFKNTQQRSKSTQPQGNQGGNLFLQRARELMAMQETPN